MVSDGFGLKSWMDKRKPLSIQKRLID